MNVPFHGVVFYMKDKGVNLNTAILSLLTALLYFGGRELYNEVRLTHDSLIIMQNEIKEIKQEHTRYDGYFQRYDAHLQDLDRALGRKP